MTDLAQAKIGAGENKQPVQKQTSKEPSTALWRDNEEFKIVKKLPRRFPTNSNDIYVTNRTDFKAQHEKCTHMLSNLNEKGEIVLHAMGPAINRAINLSLKLQKEKPHLIVNCYTSTIILEDDLIPLVDFLDISVQHRHISAVHIKITNPVLQQQQQQQQVKQKS